MSHRTNEDTHLYSRSESETYNTAAKMLSDEPANSKASATPSWEDGTTIAPFEYLQNLERNLSPFRSTAP